MDSTIDKSYADVARILRDFGLDLSPSDKQLVDVTSFLAIPVGSHIAVPSHRNLLGPWHHGIKVQNEVVMHMYGDSKEDARIQECTAAEFTAATRVVAVVQYDLDNEHMRASTVEAAFSLKEALKNHADLYDIAGFNCEHFAVLCRSGLSRYESGTAVTAALLRDECQQPTSRLRKFEKKSVSQDATRSKSKKFTTCWKNTFRWLKA